MTGAAWGLAAILAGLLALLLGVALHAWERVALLEVRVERLERSVRLLLANKGTDALAAEIKRRVA